jgi:hypothetical protein
MKEEASRYHFPAENAWFYDSFTIDFHGFRVEKATAIIAVNAEDSRGEEKYSLSLSLRELTNTDDEKTA